MDPRRHPDPQWFLRLRPQSGGGLVPPLDVCHYCPHIRALHDAAGCTSPAASLFDRNPCQCTNTAKGSLYGDPATLTQLTANPEVKM